MVGISLTRGKLQEKNAIVVCGDLYDIGVRAIKWDEREGFNGYTKTKVVVEEEDRKTGQIKRRIIQGPRYKARPNGIADVSQFFIHHSGGDGRNPSGMYETLYNTRGLSVQFAVEDDGRIYQFNDAADMCYHGGKHNRISIGVECCLYPDAERNPKYYSEANRKRTGNLPHRVMVDTIHGDKRKVFCFTEPQVEALAALAAGAWFAVQHKKGITIQGLQPPRFPRAKDGTIPRTVVADALKHVGMIGHLQCTFKKWDPAGFPWESFEALVAERLDSFWRAAHAG